jgi:hypothetical protein
MNKDSRVAQASLLNNDDLGEEMRMSKTNELISLRRELKQKLASGEYDILAERIFKWVHQIFPRLPKGDATPILALGTVHFVFSLLLSLMNGVDALNAWLPFGASAAIIFYTGLALYARLFRQLHRVLHEDVLDAFTRPDDIRDLARWLERFSSMYGVLLVLLIYVPPTTFYLQPILASAHGLKGIFGLINALSGHVVMGVVVHHLMTLTFFPLILSRYHIDLYELDPGVSPSIREIAFVIRNSAYILSLYATVFTFYMYYLKIPVFPLALLYMLPLVGIFVTRQVVLSRIVARARATLLDRLREQIEALDIEHHFDDPALYSQANAMMNYYDRVKNVNSSVFDWRVGVTLINSLLLPSVAFVLTHYDKIRAFFGL